MKNITVAITIVAMSIMSQAATAKRPAPAISLYASIELPGAHFTRQQSLAFDRQNIYTASSTGDLWVTSKKGFTPKAKVTLSPGYALTAIQAVNGRVYATSTDGNIYVIDARTLAVSKVTWGVSINCLYVGTDWFITALRQGELAANNTIFCNSPLGPEDYVVWGRMSDMSPTASRTEVNHQATTVYSLDGQTLAVLPNRPDLLGQTWQNALKISEGYLTQVTPGPYGSGLTMYRVSDVASGLTQPAIDLARPYVNTVALTTNNTFAIGTESGEIELYSLSASPTLIQNLNLRTLTGFTGINHIEVRSIVCDGKWLYATSSGATEGQEPSGLPTLFVISLR